jgi:AcrR family transcriptional regulator
MFLCQDMKHSSKMRQSNYIPTQRKLIDSTIKLFVKKGYHGTSISDISNSVKLTKGSIYFHFKSKDRLLKKILEEYEREFLDKMIEEVELANGRGVDKIKRLLKFALDFAAQNRDLCLCFTNLSTELCDSNSRYEAGIKRIYGKYGKLIKGILEEGRKDGSFREHINCNILAWNLIGAMEGNLLQWNRNKGEIDNIKFSRSFMKFLLTGICRYD